MELDPAPEPASGQLHVGEGIDRDGVRIDERADIADDELHVASLQERADALAQGRDVGGIDRGGEDQDGPGRLG
jgi:hypothetical protein